MLRIATLHKKKASVQASLLCFLLGWLAIWAADLVFSQQFFAGWHGAISLPLWAAISALRPALQILWIRWALKLRLLCWLPLALLGEFVGSYLMTQFMKHVGQSAVAPAHGAGFFPVSSVPPGYDLHMLTTMFLLVTVPLAIQWLALFRRFHAHGLWLLAALVVCPLSAMLIGGAGVFKAALRLLDSASGHALLRSPHSGALAELSLRLDEAIPVAIMGMVLYYALRRGAKTKAPPAPGASP